MVNQITAKNVLDQLNLAQRQNKSLVLTDEEGNRFVVIAINGHWMVFYKFGESVKTAKTFYCDDFLKNIVTMSIE
jgi:hypothetical protein